MRPDFSKCYDAALVKNPKLTGALVVQAHVDRTGAVTDVKAKDGATLTDPDTVACILARVKQGRFAPPPGPSGATLEIPLTFKRGST
jgi:hypothetical protein